MSNALRCYFAGSYYPGEHVYVEACFAYSHREAKSILWKQGTELQQECDGNYFEMTVRWQREHDSMAAEHGITEPGIITDNNILRDMGWSIEGDSRCANCDRAEYDGEYPLCEHCDHCEECGHQADCPDHSENAEEKPNE